MLGSVILQANGRWLSFENPVRIVTAVSAADVIPALQTMETAVNRERLFAAGFMAYEAAAAFDLAVHPAKEGLPLLWFGLYEWPIVNRQLSIGNYDYDPLAIDQWPWTIDKWTPAVDSDAYRKAIAQIKAHIADGESYQVNYTFPMRTPFTGGPGELFAHLAANQAGDYMAYMDTGRHVICSVSPELFFRLDGKVLTSKPMKGTAVRGRTLAEDQANMDWLHQSEKNRAENVMIVDMIRNDMGRVAETGSIQVPHLFEVERYPTLLQMTSTVTAHTGASLPELIAAMFPCASITGAPKKRTMEIIRELEPEPRGIYTGAVGFWGPNRQAQFNVAIRTVVIDRESQRAEFGVGSGIVWDSNPEAEYEECLLKAKVLARQPPEFSLIESLLWRPEEGYFLLEAHLGRLQSSAEYFGYPVEALVVCRRLDQFAATLSAPAKVRLALAKDGRIQLEAVPLSEGELSHPIRLGLAQFPIDLNNVFLFHKTTIREMYQEALSSAAGCDEVLLWNERGEITEASRANIVVEVDGRRLTPPVKSGLLAGTFRGYLLSQGIVKVKPIIIQELLNSPKIWLVNSVRGWQPAVVHNFESLSTIPNFELG